MDVIVVSKHSPTLRGIFEMRSVFGRSSSSSGSGAGDHLSGGAVPGFSRSTGAAAFFSANEARKLGCCVQQVNASSDNSPSKRT